MTKKYVDPWSKTEIPDVGDRHKFTILTGYKLVQDRPFCCRSWRPSKRPEMQGQFGAKYTSNCEGECGGNCNGVTTYHEGEVIERVFYADNSIEVKVREDDGKEHWLMLVNPHGD